MCVRVSRSQKKCISIQQVSAIMNKNDDKYLCIGLNVEELCRESEWERNRLRQRDREGENESWWWLMAKAVSVEPVVALVGNHIKLI